MCVSGWRSAFLVAVTVLAMAPRGWTQGAERVRVVTLDDRLAPYSGALQTICTVGVTEAEALGLELPDTVVVRADWKDEFPSFCLAVGDEIRFEACSEDDLGPYWAADPWRIRFYKIRDLLAAVIDIATRHRYPVLAEMIAATHLVPRLYDQYGPGVWPRPYDYNNIEGFDNYVKELWATDLVEKCPDMDLAAVGQLVIEEHSAETLCAALRAACKVPVDESEEIPALAEALVEATGDPGYRDRLARTVELRQVWAADDGSLPLYGFEHAADGDLWFCFHGQCGVTRESPLASGAALRLQKVGDDNSWPALLHQVPYWRYRDWHGFAALEIDAYKDSDSEQKLLVQAFDGPRRIRGVMQQTFEVGPRQARHVVLSLQHTTPVAASGSDGLFDGTFHLNDVEGMALIIFPSEGPVTLYVDNITLTAHDGP